MKILNIFTLLIVSALMTQPVRAENNLAAHRQRADIVFQKVRLAADIPANVSPMLNTSGFKGDSPVAVQTGEVTVPLPVIEKCYENGTLIGDARIAFIVGHELAHIARRHFAGDAVFNFVSNSFSKGKYKEMSEQVKNLQQLDLQRHLDELQVLLDWQGPLRNDEKNEREGKIKQKIEEISLQLAEIKKNKELDADRYGIWYMMTAGYDPETVITDGEGFIKEVNKFLKVDAPLNEDENISDHPIAETREDKLRHFVKPIVERFELFSAANRAYQLGKFDIARDLLESLIAPGDNAFYTKEVFNNLGAVYFQLAIGVNSACSSEYFTWYFEPEIEAMLPNQNKKKTRSGGETTKCSDSMSFTINMPKAVDNYRKALKLDPEYKAVQKNLLAALFFVGERDEAVMMAKRLLKTNSGDLTAINTIAVCGFIDGADRNQEIQRLNKTLKDHPESYKTRYNLARMLDLTGMQDKAYKMRQELAHDFPYFPHIQHLIRDEGFAMSTDNSNVSSLPMSPISSGITLEALKDKLKLQGQKYTEFEDKETGLHIVFAEGLKFIFYGKKKWISENKISTGERAPQKWLLRYGVPPDNLKTTHGWVYRYGTYGFEERDGEVVSEFWIE